MEAGDKVYRYEDIAYSFGMDEYDNAIPGYTLKLALNEYEVVKITPKGFWINLYGNLLQEDGSPGIDKRFVLNDSKKKFAHAAKEDASDSYKARKQRQIQILEARLEGAKRALGLIKEG